MKNKRVRIVIALILLVTMFTFAACEQTPIFDEPIEKDETQQASGEKEPQSVSGKVEIVGSTSVQPLAEDLAKEFAKVNFEIIVNVQGGGSSVGIQSALDNICDIGNASRNLKDSEKGNGLIENIVALDGIAVVVHPDNPVSDLTTDQVKQIYMGEIANWKEIGGTDGEIIVINREAASGTRGAFIELAGLEQRQEDGTKILLITKKALEANSNGALKTNVSGKKNAIGYVSLGTIDETIKAVSIDGVEATADNVKNGTYTLFRPFLMLTNGEPNEAAKAFLDFVMSAKGQSVVAQKYITVK